MGVGFRDVETGSLLAEAELDALPAWLLAYAGFSWFTPWIRLDSAPRANWSG